MTLEFQSTGLARASRIALFPGAFNPPTVAHLEICRAALSRVEQIVWVLPRAFPHKRLDGFSFGDRLSFLRAIAAADRTFSVAISEGGLYQDMANEARALFGPGPEIALLLGRDAAERSAAWDYGRPGVFDEMVTLYPLLVATRAGAYAIAPHHAGRILPVTLHPTFDDVSSTEVRNRIAAGHDWQDLVPSSIWTAVARACLPPLGEKQ